MRRWDCAMGSFQKDVAEGFLEMCGVADFESIDDVDCSSVRNDDDAADDCSSSGEDVECEVTSEEQFAHRLWVQALTFVFSSANILTDKAILAATVRTARALGAVQSTFFDVVPETWIFPDERDGILTARADSKDDLWIYKPTCASPTRVAAPSCAESDLIILRRWTDESRIWHPHLIREGAAGLSRCMQSCRCDTTLHPPIALRRL